MLVLENKMFGCAIPLNTVSVAQGAENNPLAFCVVFDNRLRRSRVQ
jgi:hypothetical protein